MRLREAPKDYSDLRVKVWAKGGGKGSWARYGDVLLQGIAAAINSKSEERWLTIHHKGSFGGKLPQRVEDLVKASRENLCYVQWGSHHGINNYADISNVILAGTLFLREQTYEALARLAADIRPGVRLPEGMLAELKQGELANAILQGPCRAVVRKSVGASCAPCEAYIIGAWLRDRRTAADHLPGLHGRALAAGRKETEGQGRRGRGDRQGSRRELPGQAADAE